VRRDGALADIPARGVVRGDVFVLEAGDDICCDGRLVEAQVVFGVGGLGTKVRGDQAARLTPLTDTDADKLIRSSASAPLLLGQRGRPVVDLGALRDLLLRVSRLAGDRPEVTDLDLSPVIARPDGVLALGARIKVAPVEPQDPFLRKLR
jgi:hypothetical protein